MVEQGYLCATFYNGKEVGCILLFTALSRQKHVAKKVKNELNYACGLIGERSWRGKICEQDETFECLLRLV